MRIKKTNKEEKKVVEKKVVHKESINKEKVKELKSKSVSEKSKELDSFLAKMNKKYKDSDNMIFKGTELKPVEFITSGITSLDIALGGGFAKDRVIGISGNQSSGKSTIALMCIAANQKLDSKFRAYYADVENTFDEEYARDLGVDMSRIYINKTSNVTDACSDLRDAIDSGAFGIAVLDSTGMLAAEKLNEEDLTGVNLGVGSVATVLSQSYRVWASKCAAKKCPLLVIEHIMMKIATIGNPEVISVGRKGLYTFSQQIVVRAQTKTEETGTGQNKVAFANQVKVKVVKNKVAVPFRYTELRNLFGKGFDYATDLTDTAVRFGVINKSASTYTIYDEKFVGYDKTRNYIDENKDIQKKLYKDVMKVYNESDKQTFMQLDADDSDVLAAKQRDLENIANTQED